jgi:hypothetical protein
MTEASSHLEVIDLAEEFGTVPYGREQGLQLAYRIEKSAPSVTLLLEMSSVEGIGISFLSPALTGLRRVVELRRENTPLVAFMNPDEDIRFTFDIAMPKLPVPGIVIRQKGELEFCTNNRKLKDTFDIAKSLTTMDEVFTSPRLAGILDCKLSATNQRLNSLLQSGAVTRRSDPTAKQGIRYLYKSITEQDLVA